MAPNGLQELQEGFEHECLFSFSCRIFYLADWGEMCKEKGHKPADFLTHPAILRKLNFFFFERQTAVSS